MLKKKKKYQICVVERRSMIVEVDAENEKSALAMVETAYRNDGRLKQTLLQDNAIEYSNVCVCKEAKVAN